jgi:thiosulfate reductase cytochrome b subunit
MSYFTCLCLTTFLLSNHLIRLIELILININILFIIIHLYMMNIIYYKNFDDFLNFY